MSSTEEAEQHLRAILVQIQREYQRAAAPYLKKLAEIEAFKAPRPLLIDISSLDPAIIKVMQQNNDKG